MKMVPVCSMLLLMMVVGSRSLEISISEVLFNYPELTTFSLLLRRTGVVNEIQERSSLTILVLEDSVLDPVISRIGQSVTGLQLADLLRYHVLLEYEGINNLRNLPNRSKYFTTLFQTTGRATGVSGSVIVSDREDGVVEVGWPWRVEALGSEVLSSVKEFPYNVSFVKISRVLVPYGVLPPSLMHEFLNPESGSAPGDAPGAQFPFHHHPGGAGAAPPEADETGEGEDEKSSAASRTFDSFVILLLLFAGMLTI